MLTNNKRKQVTVFLAPDAAGLTSDAMFAAYERGKAFRVVSGWDAMEGFSVSIDDIESMEAEEEVSVKVRF